jgi:hypothetical protein
VNATTPIEDVAPLCAARWLPYQVTAVPPDDIIEQEHVPPAPRVVNMTRGAVSDATARLWAEANNRGSGWFKWAEANDQPGLLRHLAGAALLNPDEEAAMSQGATVRQPGCNLYPDSLALFPVGADGVTYFQRKHLPADATYVLVATAGPPCAETIVYPDGRTRTITDFTAPTTLFIAGSYRADPVLGGIWFADAGGACDDPVGPPPEWCGR